MRSLTMAPLPQWGDLFSAVVNSAASDDVLAAPWCRPGEVAFWFARSAWSLAVVARWRQQLLGKQGVSVWIPDFFCNASLAPLRDMEAILIFYPVTEQMTPNLAACRELASHHSLDIFVLVHYFGQANSAEPIATFCEEHGAWLIEDAAHVLRPIPNVGEAGDCVLYSPHKHLSIPDGAVLVVRPNGPARLAEHGKAMGVLCEVRDAVLTTPGSSTRHAVIWLLKRILQRLGLRSCPSTAAFRAEAEPNVSGRAHPRMSVMARRLLTRLVVCLDAVAELREQHAHAWCQVFSWANSGASITPQVALASPYLVGFSLTQESEAEALFDRLQRAGLPVTTWPDLPPEVLRNPGTHHAAIALRHNRYYLPVHQTLSQPQLLGCGKSLLDVATLQWQARALSRDEWECYWQLCPMTNLLQSWQYGAAKEQTEGWKAQRFLITNEHDQSVAVVQVLTRVLPIVGGIARLNRGPLLMAGFTAEEEVPLKLAALQVLLREARRQRWWMLQAAPELPNSEFVCQCLQEMGLRLQTGGAWASGLINLSLNEEELHGRLNKRWKRALRKASDLGVFVENEKLTASRLCDVLSSYKNLQKTNEFVGISEKLIDKLFQMQSEDWCMNLFVAKILNENDLFDDIGYRICIHHGRTALDFVVSTNEKGRQMEANSALYWHSILHAKRCGCDWFDIGGLSEATPKGIADFKQGLNALPYKLIGEWRKLLP